MAKLNWARDSTFISARQAFEKLRPFRWPKGGVYVKPYFIAGNISLTANYNANNAFVVDNVRPHMMRGLKISNPLSF